MSVAVLNYLRLVNFFSFTVEKGAFLPLAVRFAGLSCVGCGVGCFWVFSWLCVALVRCGVASWRAWVWAFRLLVLCAVVCGVCALVAGVSTLAK